jgi:hypothetical protein
VGGAFDAGERFLTAAGNTAMVYSHAGSQVDIAALPTVVGLGGNGNWFWTADNIAGTVRVYSVGSSSAPAASYSAEGVRHAANQLALDTGFGQTLSIVDLSGGSPVRTDHALPVGSVASFAATAADEWVFGTHDGVLLAQHTAGPLQRLSYGRALSIAGGTQRASIATASGAIVNIAAATRAVENELDFPAAKIQLSVDGSVLAAQSLRDSAAVDARSLKIYALPAGTQRDEAVKAVRAKAQPGPMRLFAGKTPERASQVGLADANGKPRLVLKVEADGTASIEFLDADGKSIQRIPASK